MQQNQRSIHWLLRLYPSAWRARYGEEMLALLQDHPITFRTMLDMLFGAIDAHLQPAFRSEWLFPKTIQGNLILFIAAVGIFTFALGNQGMDYFLAILFSIQNSSIKLPLLRFYLYVSSDGLDPLILVPLLCNLAYAILAGFGETKKARKTIFLLAAFYPFYTIYIVLQSITNLSGESTSPLSYILRTFPRLLLPLWALFLVQPFFTIWQAYKQKILKKQRNLKFLITFLYLVIPLSLGLSQLTVSMLDGYEIDLANALLIMLITIIIGGSLGALALLIKSKNEISRRTLYWAILPMLIVLAGMVLHLSPLLLWLTPSWILHIVHPNSINMFVQLQLYPDVVLMLLSSGAALLTFLRIVRAIVATHPVIQEQSLPPQAQ